MRGDYEIPPPRRVCWDFSRKGRASGHGRIASNLNMWEVGAYSNGSNRLFHAVKWAGIKWASMIQGYLDYKKPEISKRSVSVSYLGGPIKKLSENARCPFLIFARKSLNFSGFARKSLKFPRTLGVRFLIIKKRETPKTLCFLCRTFLIVEVPL